MYQALIAVFRCRVLSVLMCLVLALAGSVPVLADDEASAWLKRLGPALNMTSYRGVFVYARGERVHSMQIAHRYIDGAVEERLVLQDGGTGEIVRKGMNVVCVLPETGRVQLNQVIPSGPFAEAFTSQLVPVNRWYQAEMKGEDRVAGYDVVSVALSAKDPYRYSHQLWLEKSTGLLVKSHVRNSEGDVLEQFQYTSLYIGEEIPDSEFEIRTQGREISRTLDETASTESVVQRMNGWQLGWRPEGFVPAAAPRSGKGQAVAFSDGLAAFSVFVEPAGPVTMPTGASLIGATTVYMRQVKEGENVFLVTVVGELPPQTARQVAESVRIEDSLALGAGGS
ncbi:MucB/RseB C-terminal domain-containing protein [Marinobacter sp. F3R08]|uniref:MucB/RseB C-terminal domain-containing protein n=1 Tax=Marinobacter sp. F3R08 TaxID=2841559 RepID=UPI001C0A023C|nr:MucB/RseB C-terminal domain-containing protein [Marinobacter sp. F3R08]MBU2954130.1 MucB/RseB C-terminal domain-containing protein [Marinobacter sp. F3R08]